MGMFRAWRYLSWNSKSIQRLAKNLGPLRAVALAIARARRQLSTLGLARRAGVAMRLSQEGLEMRTSLACGTGTTALTLAPDLMRQ